jgi:hypothetical protein
VDQSVNNLKMASSLVQPPSALACTFAVSHPWGDIYIFTIVEYKTKANTLPTAATTRNLWHKCHSQRVCTMYTFTYVSTVYMYNVLTCTYIFVYSVHVDLQLWHSRLFFAINQSHLSP